jgi:hypothetical protein
MGQLAFEWLEDFNLEHDYAVAAAGVAGGDRISSVPRWLS